MYKDIAQFLSAEPEWVERWLNTPMKAKYKPNPFMINEIIAGILKYLDLSDIKKYSTIHSVWNYEVNAEFTSPRRLWFRQKLLVKKYWKTVAEYNQSSKELDRAFDRFRGTNRSLTDLLYKKFCELADSKRKAFANQVAVERRLLASSNEEEREQINRHIDLLANGFDPYEVGWTETCETAYNWEDEDPLEYWNGEEPDDMTNEEDPLDYWDDSYLFTIM